MTDGQSEQLDRQTTTQRCICLHLYEVSTTERISPDSSPCPECGHPFDGGGPPGFNGPNNGVRIAER